MGHPAGPPGQGVPPQRGAASRFIVRTDWRRRPEMSEFLSRLGGAALNDMKGTPLDRILNQLMGGQPGASGLQALVDRLRGAGLGDRVESWIGSGENRPSSRRSWTAPSTARRPTAWRMRPGWNGPACWPAQPGTAEAGRCHDAGRPPAAAGRRCADQRGARPAGCPGQRQRHGRRGADAAWRRGGGAARRGRRRCLASMPARVRAGRRGCRASARDDRRRRGPGLRPATRRARPGGLTGGPDREA